MTKKKARRQFPRGHGHTACCAEGGFYLRPSSVADRKLCACKAWMMDWLEGREMDKKAER